MNIDLKGKRAVICGGSRGIGRAIALHCAEAGADVSICARGAEALEKTRAEIAAHGHKAHAASCDLAQKDQIDHYIAGAAEALGGIDILVNNASAFASTDDEAGWGGSLAVDLMATVRATQAAAPFLEQSGAGAVLNISSISAFHPSVRTTPYGVAKAAVVQYTQNRAAAFAKKGVRVNCICPGSIEFPGGSWERHKQQPQPLQRDPALDPVWPLGAPGGGGARCAVSRLAGCQLGDRPDDLGRRRPTPRQLTQSPRIVMAVPGLDPGINPAIHGKKRGRPAQGGLQS
jgi:3-oxoacyl-[acyl-carrier protein] reductase